MESKTQSYESSTTLKLIILAIGLGLCAGTGTAVSPIIQKMIDAYPDIAVSTVRMTNTIPSLLGVCVSIPLSAIFGARLKFKPLFIVGSLLFLGGMLPAFSANVSFVTVMISRIFVGVGFGIMTLRNACLKKMFSFDGAKFTTWLGIVGAITCGTSMIIQIVAGALGDIDWRYAYLVYIVALIPFFINAFILKEPEGEVEIEDKTLPKEKGKLNPKVLVYSLTIILGTLFSYPIFTGMSTLITARGIGEAAVAGTVISSYSFGQFLAGMTLGAYNKKLGRFSVAIALLMLSVGFGLIVLAQSIIVAIIGAFLCGYGFICFSTTHTKWASDISDVRTRTFAATLLTTSISIGSFLSSYWMVFANKVASVFSFLNTDAEKTYMLATILFAIMAVIFFIKDPRPDSDK